MNWKLVAFCIVLWFAYLNIASTAPCSGCTGNNCANDTNCTADCDDSACSNGGQCFIDEDGSTGCICSSGYTGATCDDDIDDCADSPCGDGGTCTDDVDGYTCACAKGFSGDNCETSTIDCHRCSSMIIEGTGNLTGSGANLTNPEGIPDCSAMGTESCTGSPPICAAHTATYDISDSVDTAKVKMVYHGCEANMVVSAEQMNSCTTIPTQAITNGSDKGQLTSMFATHGLPGIKEINSSMTQCYCDSASCNELGYRGSSTAEPESEGDSPTDSSAPSSHRAEFPVFVYGLAIWLIVFCLPSIKN